ncbi:hypothetical protein Gpo141_00004001 [Globisporangium polare]
MSARRAPWISRSIAALALAILVTTCLVPKLLANYAPNHFLGTCLTKDWVVSMEAQLGVSSTERDRLNRLVHPFLRAALQHPRYQVIDPRTRQKDIYTAECMGDGPLIYGAGANVDANGSIVDKGRINGTLIVEVGPWASNELTSQVFSILASEVYGYEVSILYIAESADLTQRMSSVGSGLCTPVHASLEVWITGIELALDRFANESVAVGGIGYFGRSGLYTTMDFIEDALDTTKYPAGPYFANFWKGYQINEPMIQAVPVSKFLKNSAFYPPTESGVCDDGMYGCLNQCSKSAACTARENNLGAGSKECLVVVMMYGYYDPGYLQAAMANNGIPAYFCFIGYDATIQYALYAQANKIPVLFYHYEPDLFHIQHAGLFDRVFLPRPVPERVALTNSNFGENGYGKATNNPVDVDFPSTKLSKYVAALLFDDQNQNSPAGSLASKITISELNMNDMLRKYSTFPSTPDQPTPEFQAACQWLKENYDTWKMWLDRLPLCTFDDHIEYEVSGCGNTSAPRTITFSWGVPDPMNASLPYTCDGGLTEYPPPLRTSRSCEWILDDSSKWVGWISTKPACDESFYNYSVSDCDAQSKRTVHYYWLLPDPKDASKSLECDASTLSLPDNVLVDCEYVPFSSPLFQIVAAVDGVIVGLLICAMLFVFVWRKVPIIKRSQYELLELMVLGGILVCLSALVYAGKPSALLCGARPLLVSSGFTTIFGALFVKSLRVYRVFMKSSMKRVTITALMMTKVLSVFYFVDTIIIGVWFGADFPHPTGTLENAKEFSGLVDRVTCHSKSFIFSALLMFWKAIVLFLGIYTSFLIRNVSADFQESIWIFSSSVMVLVCCLVVLPLAYLVDMAAVPFYGFLAGALLLCTSVVMSFMLVPKICRLHAEATSSGSSKYVSTPSTQTTKSMKMLSVRDLKDNDESSDLSSTTTGNGANRSKYPPGVVGRKISAAATSSAVRPRNPPVEPVPEI